MACCGKSAARKIRSQKIRTGVKSGRNKCPLCGGTLRRVYNFDYAAKKNRVVLRCSSCKYRAKVR